jgi:hypothetical protein
VWRPALPALSACDCDAFRASDRAAKVEDTSRTPCAGPTPSLPSTGCFAYTPPMPRPVNPQRGKTIDRRAGCGRTAHPVRSEGSSKPIRLACPYHPGAVITKVLMTNEGLRYNVQSNSISLLNKYVVREVASANRTIIDCQISRNLSGTNYRERSPATGHAPS